MPSHVETLLTTLGLPAEDASKIATLPEAEQASFDYKPYAEKVRANYQTQFKNDPTFFSDITIENLPPEVKRKLEGSQFARAANIARDRLLKGLGFTEADYADFTEEQKKEIDLFVPAIVEKYTKTKASDKQLQQDLINARKELEKYGPDYENGIKTKYESEANQKISSEILKATLIGELSGIPGLKIKPQTLAREANEILNSKYAFERIGDYNFELRQKANPTLKALKEGSSKEVTLREALLEIATNEGWIDSVSGDGKGSGKVKIEPNGKGALQMVVPPHLADKISNKIATEA